MSLLEMPRRVFSMCKRVFLAGIALACALPALAQGNPTGTISGQVTSQDKQPLPGVSVTATSPNLQGARSTTTSGNGDYILPFLPPGDYTVSFELSGWKPVKKAERVTAAQAIQLSPTLALASMNEEVVVTATQENFHQGAQAATTYKYDELIEKLPLFSRGQNALQQIANLAPGVHDTGPSNTATGNSAIAISGANSAESLFLVNGVVVNENLRGQPLTLFIEDAIQETTIQTSGVSAEFGRFSGGVLNAITKSGGNDFSGSFRTSFRNDDWRSTTPFAETKSDKLIPTYEATLGGPLLKDKLWFFGAGRMESETLGQDTTFTRVAYERVTDEKRYEGKLTWSPSTRHGFRGSYSKIASTQNGGFFVSAPIMDLASLTDREDPQTLLSLNYTGTLRNNLFLEAQYSRRELSFVGVGAKSTDLIDGTLLIDGQRGSRYHSATFCGVCTPEIRDNENYLLKANYFLSTSNLGSHNLVAGLDFFNDKRLVNNHQSGSDYRIIGTTTILRGTDIFPVFDQNTLIQWNPISAESQGGRYKTYSAFFNDVWRVSSRLTFNVGLRYDKNDGLNPERAQVAKDSKWSPRLSVTFDPLGDGRWTLNASYATYVASIASGIADATSAAGSPATYQYQYLGPVVNTNAAAATLVDQNAAIRTAFDWFFANGGNSRATVAAAVPGLNTRIASGVKSPAVDEWAAGATRRLGSKGLVRVDALYRDFQDFYSTRVDPGTGKVTNALGQQLDVRILENTNDVARRYWGINSQFSYRAAERLNLGGNYTLSRTWGNVDGENAASGPVSSTPNFYGEYTQARWNRREGDLGTDQRHKVRAWAVYDVPVPSALGRVNVSVLQHFNSGLAYGAVGGVNRAGAVDPRPFVTNPGYVTPLAEAVYFFTDRDAFRTANSTRTDISLNLSRKLGFHRSELFVQAHVVNLFDEAAVVNPSFVSTRVLSAGNSTAYQRFNPFTETPVEGVHWAKAADFGQPTSRFAYQTPRTVRFSVGVRF
jgi:outer membrane receptor protein involved in Fe transport